MCEMPGNNHTGPQSAGPMSGRGLGECGKGRMANETTRRHQYYNMRHGTENNLLEEKKILEERLSVINDTLKKKEQ